MAGALVALCSASVCAIDTEGYLRIGSADAGEPRRTCYDLPISGGHYRLGNECDLYGEFGLAHAVSADGTTYTFTATTPGTHSYYSGTQGDLQVEMGLYGALIVLPASIAPRARRVLKSTLKKGDLLLTLGAGDVWRIGEEFLTSK